MKKAMIMKRWFKNAALACAAAVAMTTLVSCNIDVDEPMDTIFPNALVTVKPVGESDFVLWVDDDTVLWPENLKNRPFGNKEVRALANVEISENKTNEGYRIAKVNWVDSIRTSTPVPSTGTLAEDRQTYGKDPVEILADWLTVPEDGYITLHFNAMWGSGEILHKVNLVSGTNPDNPYEFVFCHDARNDSQERTHDGIVAFRLSELDFPGRAGEEIDLTLRWLSYSGEKRVVFKYKIREDK